MQSIYITYIGYYNPDRRPNGWPILGGMFPERMHAGVEIISRTKLKETVNKDTVSDKERIQVGDVVEIKWYDVHSYERMEMGEIDGLGEPEATRCWGAVVRKGRRYLFIATEIGDRESDGVWIEAIPFRMIENCKVIDRIKVSHS